MITKTTKAVGQQFGTISKRNFKLSETNTAHVMQLLRTGIYADPKLAMIRELFCNARDSAVFAGKKVSEAVAINMPTRLDPNFEMIDEGVGLSDKDIDEVYLNYGDSTKRETDGEIGCLGLGSKSPFAYTNSFTVDAVKNGLRNVYIASVERDNVDDEGVGSLHQVVSDEETSDSSGVKIKVAVAEGDIHEFASKLTWLLKFFPKEERPIVNNFDIIIPEIKVALEGDDWYVRDVGVGLPYAVMGGVPYRINPTSLPCYEDAERENDYEAIEKLSEKGKYYFTRKEISLLSLPVVANVKMGAVDFQASREELRYTPLTLKTLRKIVTKVTVAAKEAFDSEVSNVKDGWDARYLYFTLNQQSSIMKNKVYRACFKDLHFKFKEQTISSNAFRIDANKMQIFRYSENHKGRIKKEDTYGALRVSEGSPKKAGVIIHDAKTYGELLRIRRALHSQLLASGRGYISLVKFNSPEAREKFEEKNQFDLERAEKLSQFEPEKPVYSSVDLKAHAPMLKFTGSCFGGKNSWKVPITEDGEYMKMDLKNGGGVYVEISRYKAIIPVSRKQYGLSDINSILKFLEEEGDVGGLYGVRRGKIGKLGSGWVELTQVFEKAFKKLLVKKDVVDFLKKEDMFKNHEQLFIEPYSGGIWKKMFLLAALEDDHILQVYRRSFAVANRERDAYSTKYGEGQERLGRLVEVAKELCILTQGDLTTAQGRHEIDRLKQEILIRYPMFRFLSDWKYRSNQIHYMADYIASIDLAQLTRDEIQAKAKILFEKS